MRPDPETGDMKEFKCNLKEKKQMFIEFCKKEGQKIIIDCQFENLMQSRDIESLSSQIAYSWNSNRKSMTPANIILTSLNPDGLLAKKLKVTGLEGIFESHAENYTSVFELDKLVYLSADSENIIEDFD